MPSSSATDVTPTDCTVSADVRGVSASPQVDTPQHFRMLIEESLAPFSAGRVRPAA